MSWLSGNEKHLLGKWWWIYKCLLPWIPDTKKAHYHLFSILPPSNSFHQKILLLSACLPFKKYFSRELLLTFPNVGWWQSVVYFPVHQILERCRKEKNEFEKKETLLYRRTNSVQSRKLLPAFDQSTTSEVATSCKLLFL